MVYLPWTQERMWNIIRNCKNVTFRMRNARKAARCTCPLIPLFKRQVALIIGNKAGAVVIESKGIGLVFFQQFPLFRTELGHVGQSAAHGIWVIMLTAHAKDWVTIPQSLLAACLIKSQEKLLLMGCDCARTHTVSFDVCNFLIYYSIIYHTLSLSLSNSLHFSLHQVKSKWI